MTVLATGRKVRKRFGQHFLRDPAVIRRIVQAIAPRPGDRLVEIGPGTGALTREVLPLAGRLEVVELDRDLISPLRAACAGQGELIVHAGDALCFDFSALAQERRTLRVFGNLPYNISTPLLFHLLAQLEWVRDLHFMLQSEVVDRLAAQAGTPAYGRLSVMVQRHCRVERLFQVGRGAFSPVPGVTSALVRLTPHAPPLFDIQDGEIFAAVVRTAFSARRKSLRNALRPFLGAEELRALGLDPMDRPETLGVADYMRIGNAIAATRKNRIRDARPVSL